MPSPPFLFLGYHRQHHVGRMLSAAVERHVFAEHRGRPVLGVGVNKTTATSELVFHVGEAAAHAARIFIVLSAHREGDPVALGNHDAGRPNLDVEFIDRTRRQGLFLIVRVVGPVGQCFFRVEFPVRGSQPALRDGGVRVECALEYDFFHVGREDAHDEEEVRIPRL